MPKKRLTRGLLPGINRGCRGPKLVVLLNLNYSGGYDEPDSPFLTLMILTLVY